MAGRRGGLANRVDPRSWRLLKLQCDSFYSVNPPSKPGTVDAIVTATVTDAVGRVQPAENATHRHIWPAEMPWLPSVPLRGGPPGQAREKRRLFDGCKGDDEPLAAVQLHIRIRRAFRVGFFASHFGSPFALAGLRAPEPCSRTFFLPSKLRP
jgi:hypothetical protein